MEMGRLFNRCGWPGISPINCLLVGRSTVCAQRAPAPSAATPRETVKDCAAKSSWPNLSKFEGACALQFGNNRGTGSLQRQPLPTAGQS